MATMKRTEFQRERDLVDLADMYLTGNISQTKMVEFIAKNRPYTLNDSTISQDLAEVRRRWQVKYLTSMDEAKTRELAHVDKLEQAYWDGWLRSIESKNREISELIEDSSKYEIPKDGPESRLRPPIPLPVHTRKKAKKMTENRDGDPRMLDGIKWCIDQRCRILGLLAPTELSIKDWRKEAQRVGIHNASEVFDELVGRYVEAAKLPELPASLDAEDERGGFGESGTTDSE